MGLVAQLRLIRDRFIAGHDSCDLCHHLDSVAPETYIRDIVDHCRVWESHADTETHRPSKPGPKRALPIYTFEELASGFDDRMAAVIVPPVAPDQLETLLRRLLPTPKPVPTELESLLQCLLVGAQAPTLVPPLKTGITEIVTLLQSLLSVTPVPAAMGQPGPIRRYWATVVCFSCGKAGHGVSRCLELNNTFLFMLTGWTAEKMGGSYAMISSRMAAGRRRAETEPDPGRGVSRPDQ